uniref:Monocarboxylate transporter 14 n=1 Tax=Mesocestoides corti TaxID=53468 RepID=A0A5K3FST9_MESCO
MAGIGYGLLYMAAIIAVTTGFDELRPMAMGIMACGSGIGASVHSILYPFIESIVTWKGLSISTAGLLLHACIFGCLLGLTPPKISAQPQVTQSAQNPISSMFSLDFRSLGLLGSGYLNLPTNPTNEASTSQANLKNAIVTPNMQHMMGSLGSFTYLVEIEKIVNQMGLFGKGDPLHRNTAFLVFIIAVFLQSLGSLSPVVLFFDMLLMEGGVTVLHPLVLADLVQLERLTEAMGWEIMLGGLGYCLSTPLATSINLWHGNIHISYLVSGILMVLGGCFAILTHWSHRTFTEDDVNRLRRRLEAALG